MKRKKILVADVPEGLARAREALAELYELSFASTLEEAISELNNSRVPPPTGTTFDMVITGIQFDDSKMFDLLQYIRNKDSFQNVPFLVIQACPSSLELDSAKHSAEVLGAYEALDLYSISPEEANELLLKTVQASFGKTVALERFDK